MSTTTTELNLAQDDASFVDNLNVPFTAAELRGLISSMSGPNASAFLDMFTRENRKEPGPILTQENAAAFLSMIDEPNGETE